MLTAEERRRYEEDGVLLLRGVIDPRDCDALRARALELVAGFDPSSVRSIFTTNEQTRATDDYFLDSGEDVRFFFEEGAVPGERPKELALNKIGHALHTKDPVFARFSGSPAVVALFAALVEEPAIVQSMYIFKQPHIGGEVRCHQDSTFLHVEPDTLVGLWFALEDATRENGCLWAVPGGHRAGLTRRFVREDRRTRFEEIAAPAWDEARAVPLEAPKGSVIVLHGRVPHLSQANTSSRSRHAYTLHAVSSKSAYLPTNWLRISRTGPR